MGRLDDTPLDPRMDAMSAAIRTIMDLLPAGMALLFYRDDLGEPCSMEVQYPDGDVQTYVAATQCGTPTIREVC